MNKYLHKVNSNELDTKVSITSINRIIVGGLHGSKNLNIDIYDNCLIVVGDNGFGKTSLLNMFYAIFSGNIKYLKDVNFEFIRIFYKVGKNAVSEQMTINKKELDLLEYFHSEIIYRDNKNSQLASRWHNFKSKKVIQRSLFDEYEKKISLDYLDQENYESIHKEELLYKYKEIIKKLEYTRKKLGFDTLFLPTYRRIEQRLEYFGIEEVEGIDINFGMNDVKNAIKDITDKIIQSSIDWISKVNGQMINEILNHEDNVTYFDTHDQNIIRKTLGRIDEKYLSESSKDRIFNLIDSGEIYSNSTLVYFLNNMLKLHDYQNKSDNKLIKFSQICNKYLKNKKIYYDEIKVSLDILKLDGEREESIDFNLLSSGEKQIISIFARLILTEDKNIAVIFDEPEISISITWQKMILEDIYKLENCGFLIASTHSPFVFSNGLKKYTIDIEERIGC
ncbi:AAA family ATPase [Psychrobacter sp. NZS113]|uniref:AAA family ATPase n=1 Tax=Psychrobacter sp. NZS113 TaxID=2792045 RepID=UPI0018CFBB57|nr:AAA family ATPase [Psychrobacter sp. NZS113]MBH0097113.1 AAA family ATPase [Psychrobacter sp. NZS113]